MKEVAKEWAISFPSHLCWELHKCSTEPALARKMAAGRDVYEVKRNISVILETGLQLGGVRECGRNPNYDLSILLQVWEQDG